jgi:caa(3)-type oxidase subunit IV
MSLERVPAVHRVLAFAALLLLATLSLILAAALRWPWGDVAVSLTIAALKAYLVLFFFMDLGGQPLPSRIAVVVAGTLALLLVGFTAMDVATRRLVPRGPAPEAAESFYQR